MIFNWWGVGINAREYAKILFACFNYKPNQEVEIVVHKTSPLADDTSTDINGGYKLYMLYMKDMSHLCSSINRELVLM